MMAEPHRDVERQLQKIGLRRYPYWSLKYLKNVEKWSRPRYKIRTAKDVRVKTRDGTRLCLDVFRPDSKGRFPALLACSGYSKDVQSLNLPPVPWESPVFDHTVEAGDHEFFVSRGYVHVILDARGTGKSDGEFTGPYSGKEQEDCSDVIEWIARQSWCDGNVGMLGISWYGVIQLLTAAQQPRHLKAIFPVHFCGNLYRHAYHEGIPWNYYWVLENVMAVNNPKLISETGLGKKEFERRRRERLQDPDVAQNSYYTRILAVPKSRPWFADVLMHPLDGPFWRERSPETKLGRIKVPVYLGTSWGGSPEMREAAFDALMNPQLDVSKRLISWSFLAQYQLPLKDLNGELLRWYDHHLKGIDTGVMDEPPMKLLIRGTNRFRYEHEWPLARTKWTKLHLRRSAKLDPEPENGRDLPADELAHHPPAMASRGETLAYTTAPFHRATEVTGPLSLHLHASVDQEDANFIVTVSAVSPAGQKTKLQHGFLKASHRALDRKRSTPWKPVHDHTRSEPVEPGRIYELDISAGAICYVFPEGHRLELELATQDPFPTPSWEKMSSMGHLPGGRSTRYRIFRDQEHPSHLLVPMIPETPEDLWI